MLQPKTMQVPFDWLHNGEAYRIVFMCSYPSYDFVFAVPLTHNEIDPSEVAFFQVRFRSEQYATGYVLDRTELEDFYRGFWLLLVDAHKGEWVSNGVTEGVSIGDLYPQDSTNQQDSLVDTFPEIIRKMRKRKKLSVREAAERMGVSHTYLSNLENGHATNPTLDILIKLQSCLGVYHPDLRP